MMLCSICGKGMERAIVIPTVGGKNVDVCLDCAGFKVHSIVMHRRHCGDEFQSRDVDIKKDISLAAYNFGRKVGSA